jgi:hypothetical protein
VLNKDLGDVSPLQRFASNTSLNRLVPRLAGKENQSGTKSRRGLSHSGLDHLPGYGQNCFLSETMITPEKIYQSLENLLS